jgi:hypothetical protein
MEAENYRQKGVGEIAEQKVVEVPKDKTFQGLQMGQVVERKIHRGKGAYKYIAFTKVSVFCNDEITDIDSRIILILNEDDIDDSLLGKLGRFKIIQIHKTCYVAVLESIVEE